MPHFLVQKEEIQPEYIKLIDERTLFHLVKVLRVKTGETVKFIDEYFNIYNSVVTEIKKDYLLAKIVSKSVSKRILKYNISLVQSVLMADSQNLLIAKAAQTGVKKIYPVITDNTSSKVSHDKIAKWQKIVSENFKQCERADMAYVVPINELRETLKKFKKENILIFAEKDCNISLNKSLEDIDKTSEIAVVIGPEGGFSDREFEYFKKEQYKLISLGNMIYKAPNAVVAAISNVVSRLEDV